MEELQLDYFFENRKEFPYMDIFDQCVYPWEALKKINDYLEEKVVKTGKKENKGTMGEFVSITGNYSIGEGTVIHANVSIEGPVLIGKNCTIMSGALIRPGTIIGDGAVVGHCCEVKHAIVQNKAKIQSFTFIGDSIIGKSGRVGSGTILANRRFDQQNVVIKYQEQKVDTGTDFFGAIVGDNSRIGGNCVTCPGTCIGPYTWILPGVQARNFIPREKRIYPLTNQRVEDNPKIELQ